MPTSFPLFVEQENITNDEASSNPVSNSQASLRDHTQPIPKPRSPGINREGVKYAVPLVETGENWNSDVTRLSMGIQVTPQSNLNTSFEQVAVEVGKVVAFRATLSGSAKSFPTNQDLRRHFELFGFVKTIQRSCRPSNGFVLFGSLNAAKKALAEPNHEVSGCRLTLKPTKPGFQMPKKKQTPSTTAAKVTTDTLPVTNAGIIFIAHPPPLVPGEPSYEALKAYFGQFGSVVSLEKEASCPVGRLFFKTAEEAQRLLAVENHFVSGLRILVHPFIRPEPEKESKKVDPAVEADLVAKCRCLMFQALTKQSNCPQPPNDAVKEHFRKFGALVAFYRKEGDSNGFVAFKNRATAQKALSTRDHVVDGCELKLIPAYRDLSQEKKYIDLVESDVVKSCRLVFQALTARSNTPCPSEEAVRSHFEKFGRVVSLFKHPVHPSGDVIFDSIMEAKRAYLAPEHVVDGCTLNVMTTRR